MRRWILTSILIGVFVLTGCTDNIESGLNSLEAEKYEEAKGFFQKEIEEGDHLDEAYRGLGIACFELETYEEAIEAFECAVEHEAERTATLYSMMGACYMETGAYEKALDVYTKALTLKDIRADLKQEIQYNLIAVYESMSDWDAAKEQMRAYREAYPDDNRVEKEADFLETR